MFVMSAAMAPVRDYPAVVQTLVRLEQYPLLEFAVAAIFTAMIQSSSAVLALLMTLAAQQLIGSIAIVPFVLGTHLGGTVTGIISSLGTPGRGAKRAAAANLIFKLSTGLVFLPFYRPLTTFIVGNAADLSRQIANCHTFFSLAMATAFLPFTARISRLLERILPEKNIGCTQAVYLDQSVLAIPERAMDQAKRQVLEMGRLVEEKMLSRVLPLLHDQNFDSLDRLTEVEKEVDALYLEISKYITSMGNCNLHRDLMNQSVQILYVTNDLEHIGDIMVIVAKNMRKLATEDLEFSREGMDEIEAIFSKAFDNFRLALEAFESMDTALATRVIKEHPILQRLETTSLQPF
jgi:phosphate:Na+ symporter